MAQILVKRAGVLTVTAHMPFDARKAAGKYGYSQPDLTEEIFPVATGQLGRWGWRLFNFKSDISSNAAIDLMHDEGTEPGEIGHLLAFGAAFPEVQRKFCVIALGSIAKLELRRYVPALWDDNNYGRNLGLHSCARGWSYHHSFLGVRRGSIKTVV